MKNLLNSKMPIGVYDSGIGGISVLYKATKFLPNENFIYLGDNGNNPYGNKRVSELKVLAKNNIDILLTKNVKAIVIACNTLSCSIFDYVKSICPVPVIATLPINISSGYNATLMATPNTINSSYVKQNFNGVSLLPLPFLAKEIETNVFDKSKINLRFDLRGVKEGTNLIILGCTHYLFVKNEIERLSGVKTVDTLDHTLKNLQQTLENNHLLNENGGKVTFIGEYKRYNLRVYNYLKRSERVVWG